MTNKPSLSYIQYILLIYKIQIGIGVLTLPRDLFLIGGYDSWLAIFVGWIVSAIISFCIIRTLEKHPGKTLFDLLPQLFGKWLGNILVACWAIYGLFISGFVFLYTISLIKVWILPNTNFIFTGLLIALPIFIITKHGLPIISRYAEFTFLVTIWMYPVILMTSQQGLWQNLLPIARDGLLPIANAMPLTILSFLGLEQVYFFYDRLNQKQKAIKGLLIANTMTGAVLLMVTILSFIRMSDVELMNAYWPTLDLLKLIRFPFLERLEIIFISAYIVVLLMTIIPSLHMALVGATKLLRKPKWYNPLLIIILLAWIAMLYTHVVSYRSIISIRGWMYHIGLAFGIFFPVALWLYNLLYLAIRKRGQAG